MKTEKPLLVEINIMRSMMGLREKSMLITENIIVGLAKSFAKTAARNSDTAAKIMSDFLTAGSKMDLIGAERLKGFLNDLDIAVKEVDDLAITSAVKNILEDSEFGASAAAKIADDMFDDSAADAITSVLNKRASDLKGSGLTDAAVKSQIKNDIDALLGAFPDTLKTAAKSKADGIINDVIKAAKDKTEALLKRNEEVKTIRNKQIADGQDLDSVLNEMKVLDTYQLLPNNQKLFIDKWVKKAKASGDQNGDIILEAQEKIIKFLTDSTTAATQKGDFDLVGKITKTRSVLDALSPKTTFGWVVLIGGLFFLTGGTIYGFMGYMDKFKGSKEDYEKAKGKKDDELTGTCDQTLDSFKAYLVSENYGVDGATFDTNECKGVIDAVEFTYDTNLKTWK